MLIANQQEFTTLINKVQALMIAIQSLQQTAINNQQCPLELAASAVTSRHSRHLHHENPSTSLLFDYHSINALLLDILLSDKPSSTNSTMTNSSIETKSRVRLTRRKLAWGEVPEISLGVFKKRLHSSRCSARLRNLSI